MMQVSEKAAEKARDLFKEKGLPEDTGLRVFVVGGGCSGYQYGMALARDVDAEDLIIENRGVKIVGRPG